MLPITLETSNQINLFQPRERSAPHFELQIINEGLFPEVRLYYLENNEVRKTKKQKKKRISSSKKNNKLLTAEYPHVIKLAV